MSVDVPRVIWSPLAGSQSVFLTCPILECLIEGTRGSAKTDGLIMDFARDVGRGHGEAWFGIIFRQTYKQLEDVVRKSNRWFRQIFPEAKWSKGDYRWTWPDGETLLLRYMDDPEDYWNYHGWEVPWIGWEELTNWPDLECYHRMKSCCRSSYPGVPRRIRSTANPWGVGHNAVKSYFIDPAPPGVVVESRETGLRRVRIHAHWSENEPLLRAQPDYPQFIAASASSEAQKKAWLGGDWDVIAGGRFDDVWDRRLHLIEPWLNEDGTLNIPKSWRIDRSYDWGHSKPFSVGWWAESDGTVAPDGKIYPRGSLVRISEWYGWDERTPNVGLRMSDKEIALGIVAREESLGIRDRVKPGPADSSIFQLDGDGKSIAGTMAKHGVRFTEADKRPGSRNTGWKRVWDMLKARRDGDREAPWMLVFDTCRQFVRCVPTLPRDKRDPDDVDTAAEDHIGDETRYRATARKAEMEEFEHRV